MPTILVSNVKDRNCWVGPTNTFNSSVPDRSYINDFKVSIEQADEVVPTPKGEDKHFLTVHIHKVGDVKKDDVRVVCDTTLAVQSDTFSDRKLAVYTNRDSDSSDENLRHVKRQGYSINFSQFAEHDGFRVFGGSPNVNEPEADPAASRLLPGKTWPFQATVVWRDKKMASLRDAVLVISGSLLGFSCAFFVEWLRSKTGVAV